MKEELSRTALLLGDDAMEKLAHSTVAIFGVGGVGGYVAEALARSGVGRLVLTDNDTVSVSNINRQIIALHSTIGRPKVEVIAERLKDINPDIELELHQSFYLPQNHDEYSFKEYAYVVDCVDTVAAKIDIIMESKAAGTPVISSMGAGNKLNPVLFEVTDIYKTSVCPLARVMRYEMKKRGVKGLKVVFSKEAPMKVSAPLEDNARRSIPGSIAFVPAAAGLVLASEIVRDLL
ncbi:MAG: tRNA threonylcarbamoyladenosine dehydratase [Eubacteriales bacterium]|nr:tRNA threonylcarbamoyladenosine dehydratase [Eubacteriales bacterium]